MQVNILDAKNRLSQLIKLVLAGEEVIIANRGEPVVRLAPTISPAEALPISSGRAWLDWLDAHPMPAHRRRRHEEIQAGIDEERSGWD